MRDKLNKFICVELRPYVLNSCGLASVWICIHYLNVFVAFILCVCRLTLTETPYEINPISRFSSPYLCIRVSLFSLKLECEKLANEKTEMQRHYVMVSSVLGLIHIPSAVCAFQHETQRIQRLSNDTHQQMHTIEQITRSKLPLWDNSIVVYLKRTDVFHILCTLYFINTCVVDLLSYANNWLALRYGAENTPNVVLFWNLLMKTHFCCTCAPQLFITWPDNIRSVATVMRFAMFCVNLVARHMLFVVYYCFINPCFFPRLVLRNVLRA
jgi:hypothetical protein